MLTVVVRRSDYSLELEGVLKEIADILDGACFELNEFNDDDGGIFIEMFWLFPTSSRAELAVKEMQRQAPSICQALISLEEILVDCCPWPLDAFPIGGTRYQVSKVA